MTCIDDMTETGEPYCSNCGYQLTGLVNSSKCPECGRPIVEVLTRRQRWPIVGKRYRSNLMMFGIPLIHIALGPHEDGPRGRARGIVAIGDIATGVFALGGIARGVFAIGGLAVGLVALGGMAIGLLTCLGGLAIGGLAVGGFAGGVVAHGGFAAGGIADGGLAAGYVARGGLAVGAFAETSTGAPSAASRRVQSFGWLIGTRPGSLTLWLNIARLVAAAAIATGIILLYGYLFVRSDTGAEGPSAP